MRTRRILPPLALLVLATLGLAACAAINQVVTDPDLTCEATPVNLCTRVADVAVNQASTQLEEFGVGPTTVTTVEVRPMDCAVMGRERVAPRCWRVTMMYVRHDADDPLTAGSPDDIGAWVYERPDGTLGVDE
jgi:hypothetical protein